MESHQPNSIAYQDISGVGLFFARKEDPVNLFSLQVTKQLYSLIGFYYESKVTGKKRIHIILSDICGIVSSRWMNHFTIENLINDPLVTRLSIRRLCHVLNEDGLVDEELTLRRDADFKAAIAEVTSEGPVNSTEDWIKQMFGYEISQPGRGSTTVELVNKVIMATGNWEKIVSSQVFSSLEGVIANESQKPIPKNTEGKNYIFSRLCSDMKQVQVYQPSVANVMIQNYLVENGVFEPIKHITLPKHSQLELNLRREQSISESKEFLADAVATFVRLLLENKKFFNVVVDGINANTELRQKQNSKQFKASVLNMLQSNNRLIGVIVSMIQKGKFSFELLKHEIEKYNSKLEHTIGSVGLKSHLIPYVDSKYEHNIVLIENDGENKFKFDLGRLHHNLNSALNEIKNGETPTLNINDMVKALNSIISSSSVDLKLLKPLKSKKSYGAVLTTQEGTTIPLQLSHGKRILLPTVGYDLSPYGCRYLRELLHALDVMADGNDDFDKLRADIANKYAQCEDLKCTYH